MTPLLSSHIVSSKNRRNTCGDYANLSAYRDYKGCDAPSAPSWPAATIRSANTDKEKRVRQVREEKERGKTQVALPKSDKPGLKKRPQEEDEDGDDHGNVPGGFLGVFPQRPISNA